MIRISRPCYDKYHRCPGWNGGGLRYAKRDRCDGGYVTVDYDKRCWTWRSHRCNKCRVIVLPYRVRWFDPSWWWSSIRSRFV